MEGGSKKPEKENGGRRKGDILREGEFHGEKGGEKEASNHPVDAKRKFQ